MKRSYFRMSNGVVYTKLNVEFKLTSTEFVEILLDYLTNTIECKTLESFETAIEQLTKRQMIEQAKFYFFVNGNSHSFDYQYEFSGCQDLDEQFRDLLNSKIAVEFPTLFV